MQTPSGTTAGPADDYIGLIKRRWWLLVLIPLLAAGSAYGLSSLLRPTYLASATMLVRLSAPRGAESPTVTYSNLVESRPVLQRVVTKLQLPQAVPDLASEIDVTTEPNAQIIRVSGEYHDPQLAARVVNAVAEEFIGWLGEEKIAPPGVVRLVARAAPPEEPSGPNILLNTGIGLFLGLALAAASIVLLERMDDRVWAADDVQRALGLQVLASISRPRRGIRRSSAGPLDSSRGEAIRSLQMRLQFSTDERGLGSLLITSPSTKEDKSRVAADLAVAIAQSGPRVVLVDGDLRRARQQQIFSTPAGPGLATLMLEPALEVQDVMLNGAVPGLQLLPAGAERHDSPVSASASPLGSDAGRSTAVEVVKRPSELLTDKRLSEIFAGLRRIADTIVIDAPPILGSSEVMLLAAPIEHVLIVVEAGQTRLSELRRSVSALGPVSTRIVGVVLVGVEGDVSI